MSVRRFFYLCLLLLLPALLIVLSTAWNPDSAIHRFLSGLSAFLLVMLYVLIIPIGFCIAINKRPQWFTPLRLLDWTPGILIFSWAYTNVMVWFPSMVGLDCPDAPGITICFLFGWIYLPLAMGPVLTIYTIVQLIHGKIPKQIVLGMVAVLAFICCAFVIESYCIFRLAQSSQSSYANQSHQPKPISDTPKNEGDLQ